MKKANLIIWTVAGILSLLALLAEINSQQARKQYQAGGDYAITCLNNGGVIMSDSKGLFCWYE